MASNGLPVAENLSHRGVMIQNFCPLCGNPNETIIHLFKDCHTGILLRQLASPLFSNNNPNTDFLDWVRHYATSKAPSSLQIPLGTLFIYLLWHLWIARNKKVFQYWPFSPHSTLFLAKRKVAEFHFLAADSPQFSQFFDVLVSWLPPPSRFLKLNSDGAHDNISNLIAAGGIIRDENGNWICGYSKFLGFGNALLAELWGIHIGLSICIDRGLHNILVESDSQLAVNLILNHNTAKNHVLFPLIESCRSGLAVLHSELRHIYREGNFCSDMLAKTALAEKNDLVVLDSLPSYLLLTFGNDLAGRAFSRKIGIG